MPRIPDGEIERLKCDVDLVRLLTGAGHALKAVGKDLATRCPFHDGDDTPSLIVTPGKNMWHCFGCERGGSVIDWVMQSRHVSFRHAVELLRQSSPALSAPHTRAVRSAAPAFASTADDAALLEQVIGYYHATLKESPDALAYLAARGLTHPEVIDRFSLGYANRTLGYRLPEKNRQAGAALRGNLQRLGLLRSSGHEHFNGSLVIPVRDEAGHVAEVYGRKLLDNLRPGTPTHLYLPGPHRGVFNLDGWRGTEELILCEALIDALTFWCAGYRNVSASYGVGGFTDEIAQALVTHGVKRVLIAYDRDPAGDAAAEKLVPVLKGLGLESYRILFPKGMDVNQYALAVTPADKSLGVAIRSAEWLGNGRPRSPRTEILPVESLAPSSINDASSSLAAKAAEPAAESGDLFAPAAGAPAGEPAADASTSEPATDLPGVPAVVEPVMDTPAMNTETVQSTPAATDPSLAAEPLLPAPPAYRVPPVPSAPAVQADAHELNLLRGERHYRVRGLDKNLSYEQLKVTVRVSLGERIHVDALELFAAKQRAAWVKQASIELGLPEDVLKADLGALLLACEARQDELIRGALRPGEGTLEPERALTEAERTEALALLRDPELIARILADFDRLGLVGEPVNALVGYLAAVSRKLAQPLALIVQSTSAAGKSALMDAVLALVPEEDRVHYSAMTGQSLFYIGERDLKHKLLAIAEEEGVRQAAYALKLLQSQGELTIASTGKDPATGRLVTEEYRVEGPVMLFLTTTAIDLDEELLNRCLVLAVNESREQTRAIQARQRKRRTLAGLMAAKDADALTRRHQNAQRLLRPLAVVNPYAERLGFLDERTRTRRDHQKYLTLIDAIAFLHQHQREVKRLPNGEQLIDYIEVTSADIALANRLAHQVLGQSLDELPPQTRRVLAKLTAWVKEHCEKDAIKRRDFRFSRRELREATGIGDTQLRVHLGRLVELEYLLVHRGARGQSFVYELLYDGNGDEAAPHLPGLIDVDTPSSRGDEAEVAGSTRGERGPLAAGSRPAQAIRSPLNDRDLAPLAAASAEPAAPGAAGAPARMPVVA